MLRLHVLSSSLYILGNYSEFEVASKHILSVLDFDIDRNVSVFETNIRVLGGLLSGHFCASTLRDSPTSSNTMSWYTSEFLVLAYDLGLRLLPAFDTATGIPYGTVNLRHGVPPNETPITSLATGGTNILEFIQLSRITGAVCPPPPRLGFVYLFACLCLFRVASQCTAEFSS